MTKEEKIKSFDPNSIGNINAGMFGLPFSENECEIALIPVPWEVTVSYGGGTVNGPAAIREASYQVDLYDPNLNDAWHLGIFMEEENADLKKKSEHFRKKAEKIIADLAEGKAVSEERYAEINQACNEMNAFVKQRAVFHLQKKKVTGMVGGDHSTPLGMMQAVASYHKEFGVLHIDAHADLRKAYEGFTWSHASIMYNALEISELKKLVQVGIRDYCEEELNLIRSQPNRIHTWFDRDLKQTQYRGETWNAQCEKIIKDLPKHVYLSFDIDGLDPKLCPNTGTPVAGGFETEQVLFLLEKLVDSGREIVAFDLNEVSPAEDNDWDANVGARLLYRICNLAAKSQGKGK